MDHRRIMSKSRASSCANYCLCSCITAKSSAIQLSTFSKVRSLFLCSLFSSVTSRHATRGAELVRASSAVGLGAEEDELLARQLFAGVSKQLLKRSPGHPLVVHAFDSYSDYEHFYTRFKEDLANLLRLIASLHPTLAVDCMLQLANDVQLCAQQPPDACLPDWESVALVMDCVCNKLPESKEVLGLLRQSQSVVLTAILLDS